LIDSFINQSINQLPAYIEPATSCSTKVNQQSTR